MQSTSIQALSLGNKAYGYETDVKPQRWLSPFSPLSPHKEDFVSVSVLEVFGINIRRTEESLGNSTLLPIWRHKELLQFRLQQHGTSPFNAAKTTLGSSGKEKRYDD